MATKTAGSPTKKQEESMLDSISKTTLGFLGAGAVRQESDRDEGKKLPPRKPSRFGRLAASEDISVKEFTQIRSPIEGYLKQCMMKVPVPKSLHEGIRVTKITSYGKRKPRILTISDEKFAIFVTHARVKGGIGSSVATKLPLPLFSRKGIRGFGKRNLRDQYVRYMDVSDLDSIQTSVVGTRKLELARDGSGSRLKGFDSKVDQESETIVTIRHHGSENLDVLIADETERKAFVDAVRGMMAAYRESQARIFNEAGLLRYVWYDIDADRSGDVGEREFVKLLNRINLYLKNPRKIYKDFCNEKGAKELTFPQTMDLLTRIKLGQVEGVKQQSMALLIWDDVFGKDTDYVSSSQFLTEFMHTKQKETDATEEDVEMLFATINKVEMNRDETASPVNEHHLNRFRFQAFLHHAINDVYNPDDLELDDESLSRPMSQYWINTSHNTYLCGDQLQSTSSVEMYMKALHRGCKCLELDCWDGEKAVGGDPIPVVFHGHTLTSKICFADIIRGVKAYMDENKDTLPVILSLENHCSKPYQTVMANTLRDLLGDYLYVPTFGGEGGADTSEMLPSPEELRGKVVIKGKRPPEPDETTIEEEEAAEEFDPYDSTAKSPSKSPQDPNKKPSKSPDTTGESIDTKPAVTKSSKIVPELALMTLFHGTKFKEFDKSIQEPPSHMHSINENKISKILTKDPANGAKWREYNVNHMTRTYPAGSRVDSSNYNPVLAWAMGCQMVALNFQTSDSPLLINDGQFRQNGGCGYVLKPPAAMKLTPLKPVTFKFRILSGSCLPKPDGAATGETIDPYVQVVSHDVVTKEDGKEEYASSTYYNKCVPDNGFCPVWNETGFQSFEIQNPEMAMIQFTLMEEDVGLDDKVGHAVIPFRCLRRGYRSINLYHKHGTRTGPFSVASLLVEIDY